MNECRVLFVCTGNICRSPTAEGVFREIVARQGLAGRIHADSVGTHGYHVGDPPDRRAIATARGRGIDLSGLRARRIEPADFDCFDMIIAMDEGHYHALRSGAGQGAKAALSLFMDYAPNACITGVPDPYYGTLDDFEYVLDLVEQGAAGLLDVIKQDFLKV